MGERKGGREKIVGMESKSHLVSGKRRRKKKEEEEEKEGMGV